MRRSSVISSKKQIKKALTSLSGPLYLVAERTGLEPATPCVTGRYSNQLNYRSTDSVLRPHVRADSGISPRRVTGRVMAITDLI